MATWSYLHLIEIRFLGHISLVPSAQQWCVAGSHHAGPLRSIPASAGVEAAAGSPPQDVSLSPDLAAYAEPFSALLVSISVLDPLRGLGFVCDRGYSLALPVWGTVPSFS